MTDQQIVSALRICADHPGGDCRKCPYFTKTGCFRKILLDAADRLECREAQAAEKAEVM